MSQPCETGGLGAGASPGGHDMADDRLSRKKQEYPQGRIAGMMVEKAKAS